MVRGKSPLCWKMGGERERESRGVVILLTILHLTYDLHIIDRYTEVQAVPKPEQYDGEVLDLDDPDNSYFIYCMKKNETLVNKKLGKALKDLKNKNKKKQQAKAGAPQL